MLCLSCHRRLSALLVVALLGLPGAACALGDDATDLKRPPQAITPEAPPTAPLTTEELVGHKVVDAGGIDVGTLQQLVVDANGRTRYVILAHRGVLNTVEYILAPWQVLDLSVDLPLIVTLDMTIPEFKHAPRIARHQDWTSLADVDWREIDRFYIRMFGNRGDSLSALRNEFALLDIDNSCHLSPREAALLPELSDHFGRADTNQDQSLDQGEFIRFETAATTAPRH